MWAPGGWHKSQLQRFGGPDFRAQNAQSRIQNSDSTESQPLFRTANIYMLMPPMGMHGKLVKSKLRLGENIFTSLGKLRYLYIYFILYLKPSSITLNAFLVQLQVAGIFKTQTADLNRTRKECVQYTRLGKNVNN